MAIPASPSVAGPASSHSAGRDQPWALGAGGLVVVVLGAVGVLVFPADRDPGALWMTATMGLSFAPLGAFVLHRVPGHVIGRLMLLVGGLAISAAMSLCWSAFLVGAWLSQWLWWPPISLIPLLLLLFPDGHLLSRRWVALAGLILAASVVTAGSIAIAAFSAPRTFLTSLDTPTRGARRLAVVAVCGVVVLLGASVVVVASQVLRWRRATPARRRQLACLAPSGVLLVVGVLLDYINIPGAWIATVVVLPIGMTFAIVQYRFYDLDLYINRGLIWLILTGITVALFSVTLYAVALASTARGSAPPLAGTLLACAVAAAALLPAERVAQRSVSRLLYGRRDDPFSVLIRLGQHVESMRDPLAVLPEFVATVVTSLRIPYAALVLRSDSDAQPMTVENGRPTGDAEHFAMIAHGVEVGELVVATRRPGAGFMADERELLRSLAGQAAAAAETVRSTLDLQRARERLVLAREEERRALRGDLHDGVAAALVGARMKIAAISSMVGADDPSRPHLMTVTRDLDTCAGEVRAMIDGLRPAALDDGLEQALRRLVDVGGATTTATSLTVVGALDDLPAAIEVAVYRIATEALTNVHKHAGAARCDIELRRVGNLVHLSVFDDGIGIGTDTTRPDAVGLGSLRSRAEEVGGSLVLETPTEGGTRLRAIVPTHVVASTVS